MLQEFLSKNKKTLLVGWIILTVCLGLAFLILSKRLEYVEVENSKFLNIKYPDTWESNATDYSSENIDQESYQFVSEDGLFTVKISYEYWKDNAIQELQDSEGTMAGNTTVIPSLYDAASFDVIATINGSDYVVGKTGGTSSNDGVYTSGDPVVGIEQRVYQVYKNVDNAGISPILSFYADRDENGSAKVYRYFTVSYTFNSDSGISSWSSYKSVLSEIISSIRKRS